MEYKEIYKSNLSGAYLFYGEEKFLMNDALDYIKKKYINQGLETFNYVVYEGKDLSERELVSACETLPVMNEKRVIFVKDAISFSEIISDDFFSFIKNLGDFIILIFIDSDSTLNKVKKFYKYFQKNKRNIEFPKLKGRDIYKFAEVYFAKNGKNISNSDLSYFIAKSNYGSRNIDISLYDLKNEMDKIIALAEKDITHNIIDASITENADTNIFKFLDFMCMKDTENALIEFRNLHYLNEPLPKILFMFTRTVRNLINYKTLHNAHYRDSDIMKELKVSPFEFKKIIGFSRNFSIDFLYEFYKKILRIDESIKSSGMKDNVLFEMLIVEFTKGL